MTLFFLCFNPQLISLTVVAGKMEAYNFYPNTYKIILIPENVIQPCV